jgi:hypothetical protein
MESGPRSPRAPRSAYESLSGCSQLGHLVDCGPPVPRAETSRSTIEQPTETSSRSTIEQHRVTDGNPPWDGDRPPPPAYVHEFPDGILDLASSPSRHTQGRCGAACRGGAVGGSGVLDVLDAQCHANMFHTSTSKRKIQVSQKQCKEAARSGQELLNSINCRCSRPSAEPRDLSIPLAHPGHFWFPLVSGWFPSFGYVGFPGAFPGSGKPNGNQKREPTASRMATRRKPNLDRGGVQWPILESPTSGGT